MSDFSREGFETAADRRGLRAVRRPAGQRAGRLSIDEKTGIQAKGAGRSQPDRGHPGRAGPARREHEYRRNGTNSLFAASKVHHLRAVLAMSSKVCNRWDLIRYLDQLEAEIPIVDGQKIVAVTGNLSTRPGPTRSLRYPRRIPAGAFSSPRPAHSLTEPDRDLLLDPRPSNFSSTRILHQRTGPRAPARYPRSSETYQPDRQAVRLDLHRQDPQRIRARITGDPTGKGASSHSEISSCSLGGTKNERRSKRSWKGHDRASPERWR